MNNNLSLLKIISGISKTLNVANQIIPIYKQVKPIITNSSKYLSQLHNSSLFNKTNNNTNNQITSDISTQQTNNIQQSNSNGPVFFQ